MRGAIAHALKVELTMEDEDSLSAYIETLPTNEQIQDRDK